MSAPWFARKDRLSPGRVSLRSPGFALSLVSTSTTGVLHCAEALSGPGVPPEDVAERASHALLCEISHGGCVGRSHQAHALLLMAVGPEDVGHLRLGQLTANAVQMLRDIKEFTGVSFKIAPALDSAADDAAADDDEEVVRAPRPQELIMSCVGCGVRGARKAA